ncbi:sigma-54-dependent Fis family transcriptional regulator [Pokkaliibacter sp. MBI-7]|uniref:sigma-54-dependent Fis family transcriptional regulator n=1 Tax=Pokkaliibacter sp. MBI-7 TaxID=3040600 RepID=UPI0024470C85|nr:sigma-54-dependent Fis family transcriptional regulator [Pokkaliibacter sp. MBI-7]MDH2432569.1 sigma-54-dependent Fis family transcriptional regulator [Pokkaliibacter sp. MBI-7]
MKAFDLAPAATLDHLRRQLIRGEHIPDGILPASIARSWTRSRDAGIHPWEPRLSRPLHTEERRSDSDQLLCDVMSGELERLWQAFGGDDWTVFCLNLQGVLIAGRQASPRGSVHALRQGVRVHEADIGTTAPSITLIDGLPMVLQGAGHYLKEFERFYCVSVPVYDHLHQLVGALDLTGIGKRNTPLVMEQFQRAALCIENRLFVHHLAPRYRLLSLQPDASQLGATVQGLLAVDDQGRLLQANSAARRMLGWQSSSPLPESHRDELSQRLHRLLRTDEPDRLALQDGSHLYAQPYQPLSNRRPRHTASQPAVRTSPQMSALQLPWQQASKAFAAGIPVLLQGETGTGKEVFARQLHDQCCPDAPFIALNCAAIPESLIEAELFGYEDGSFTGARRGGASGRLEDADGGTLLLDEIGDMPLALQSRLLRVLQERQVTRLGSSQPRPVSFRLISASHCDLPQMLARRLFRADLFYRLSGLTVTLPPLRQRQDFNQILDLLCARYGTDISLTARQLLATQPWPGNIRQLEHCVHLASVLASPAGTIEPQHLPGLQAATPSSPCTAGLLHDNELQLIASVVAMHNGNLAAAARELGISRTTLYKKIRANPHLAERPH